MANSLELINQRVTDALREGATVDVYRLATDLQPHCPDLSRELIAAEISAAVVKGHGNALWNKI